MCVNKRVINPSIFLAASIFAAIAWAISMGSSKPLSWALIKVIAVRSSKSGGEISTISPASNLLLNLSSSFSISEGGLSEVSIIWPPSL